MLSPLISAAMMMYLPQIALLHTSIYMYIDISVMEFIYHTFWSIFISSDVVMTFW